MELGRRDLLLGLGLALGACGAPPASPNRSAGASSRASGARSSLGSSETFVAKRGPFELHSGFWLNLHHWLWAQAATGDQAVAAGRQLAGDVEPLGADQRDSVEAALAVYRSDWTNRDLLFDDQLHELKGALAAAESALTLESVAGAKDLVAALERAASPYAAHAWPIHDKRNRTFVDALSPQVERHGSAIVQRLAELYRAPFPGTAVRVDVCVSANWAGAYTSIGPPVHVVIASAEPSNQGSYALEILFHEASHGMMKPLQDAIAAAAKGADTGQLWHAVLFHSAGALVASAVPGHEPYADRQGLWERGRWADYRRAVLTGWQPYLDGKSSFDDAIAAMIRAL